MKRLLRFLAGIAAICGVILLVTFTYAITKRVWVGAKHSKQGHVRVLDVSGIIASSSAFLKEAEEIGKNPATKAILLRVNSPGGLVAPSQEIYQAILKLDKKIPVIVSMGALAASGGYYVALGGRKIYANSGTLTASIGVIMEFANTSGLYKWARIERFTIKAGKFKDVGSPLREMTPAERELLTTMATDIHAQFRGAVQDRRKLTQTELDGTADGRVMTGSQAKAAKLVDALGGFQDALEEARRVAQLPEDAPVVYPESKKGLFQRIVLGDDEGGSEGRVSSSIGRIIQNLGEALQFREGAWRVMLLAPFSETL